MIFVGVFLFKDPEPGDRKVPDPQKCSKVTKLTGVDLPTRVISVKTSQSEGRLPVYNVNHPLLKGNEHGS